MLSSHRGPQLDSGSKVSAAGLSDRSCGSGDRGKADPRVSSHSAGRSEETQAAPGHGLLRRRPLGGRVSIPPRNHASAGTAAGSPQPPASPGPEAAPQPPLRLGPRPGRTAAVRSAGPDCLVFARAPRRRSRVRPPAACLPMPTAMPHPARPGPATAAQPRRDSWVPKGLSRQRRGPSPSARCPSATSRPQRARARPLPAVAFALLLHLAALSRGPPLSPPPRLGAAHSAGYSDTARGGGAWSDYHILAYQCASRGLSSQWSLWKGGDSAEHA